MAVQFCPASEMECAKPDAVLTSPRPKLDARPKAVITGFEPFPCMTFKPVFFGIALLALGCPAFAADAPALTECHPRGGLPNFYARLRAGSETTVAYLGGSITAQDGWRPLTFKWFQREFPGAPLKEVNAAIGGTGSDLGVFRLRNDVLSHKPNLIFVEFAVNDGGAAPEQIHRCMEGIVRQAWRDNPETDLCFVYTLAGGMLKTLQDGQLPRSAIAMEQVADHYGIPSIALGLEVARLEKEGKLVFNAPKPKPGAGANSPAKIYFSPDGVHPYTDSGHALYFDAVKRAAPALASAGKPGPHALVAPFSAGNLEEAKLVPLDRATLSAGWRKLDATNRLAKSFSNRLPALWSATSPGETLQFRFRGTMAGVYDLLGPDCGQLAVTLDNRPPSTRARFDSYCTYHRLAMLTFGSGLSNTVHTVKVQILPDPLDKAAILSKLNNKIDDPKRFEGKAWHAGALMLIGELVE